MSDTQNMVRIAEASTRLRLLLHEAYDELPAGYTHESLQFDIDLAVVLDLADGAVAQMARG